MPRTLPWKRREQDASPLPRPRHLTVAQRSKRKDAEPALDEEHSAASSGAGTPAKNKLKRFHRSASTSLSPEPLPESFMIEGLDGDDRYRMVEDEFLATAQQFTAHLHVAEYKRLQKASKLENAQAIKDISRPVVGRMTDLVKMKQERKVLEEKQRSAIRKIRKGDISDDEATESDNGNASWQRKSLHGLMESPGKRAKRLGGLPTATSVTRAAAGFSRQSTDDLFASRLNLEGPYTSATHHSHKSEGGLDAPKSHNTASRSLQPAPISSKMRIPDPIEVTKLPLTNSYKVGATPQRINKPNIAEDMDISDGEGVDFITRLKKRQAERRRSRVQRKSTGSKVNTDPGDILPDFL
ncbi:hypothetical protein F5Y19DRAFT_382638 [Xylariaceae sp. FL1651]|nr:hypothetical protein F5Y19DRAFT_382638 [Xylariaceae sp. FL1651]